MNARIRQAAWTAAALVVPVALSVALLPLRDHVDDVLVAVVLLGVSAAVLARAEWPPRIVAGVSAALSFNYFYAQPYDQFGGGVQAVETTVVLGVGGADASRGSGLTGIRDRVEAVGGTLAVHSPPGSGTVLTARLPPGDPFG